MANFLRMLVGVALLPACWGVARAFFDAVLAAGDAEGVSPEALSLLGGIAAFALCWLALSHPVRAYVLGHELTHAIWGVAFGARPSKLRVSGSGGSVNLTKTNMFITLAPYFFPFYTFVVVAAALATLAFVRPLPFLPLWMFMIGFTWAFHAGRAAVRTRLLVGVHLPRERGARARVARGRDAADVPGARRLPRRTHRVRLRLRRLGNRIFGEMDPRRIRRGRLGRGMKCIQT